MACRIKNRHTFKSLPILNSAYFTECRFVIRHITQTDTETETEANFTHIVFHTSMALPQDNTSFKLRVGFRLYSNAGFIWYISSCKL